MLIRSLLQSIIHKNSLRLITANNREYLIGDGSPPKVTIKLHRRILEWTLGLDPQLKIGEAYMEGDLTIEQGGLRDFLELLFANFDEAKNGLLLSWLEIIN